MKALFPDWLYIEIPVEIQEEIFLAESMMRFDDVQDKEILVRRFQLQIGKYIYKIVVWEIDKIKM